MSLLLLPLLLLLLLLQYSLEKLGARHIVARGDSQLVVRQMTGQYKVNGERLLPLHREAKLLEQRCESFQIEHIYRCVGCGLH
jgi:ribonuclease HI